MDKLQEKKYMKILIAGGKLQGVEASYLSQKCGFETILIDKDKLVPAKNFCTRFIQMDIFNREQLSSLLNEIDIVIPALENQDALDELSAACVDAEVVMVFSSAAYTLSSSKKESKTLFNKLKLHTPKPWPECQFPVILKPSFGSGSKGVRIFPNDKDLNDYYSTSKIDDNVIIEEYLHGKQYSLEIIGFNGRYKCLQVTELEMDDIFDCKRVIAPSELSSKEVTSIEEIALLTARAVDLNGIMDIEVINHNGEFIVLEIDARLPSQTPIAVFWSTGFNIIENLVHTFLGRNILEPLLVLKTSVLEHIKVDGETLIICGEHIMTEADDLQLHHDFFGADEALSDYRPGKTNWVATIIVTGKNRSTALAKKAEVIGNIRKQLEIKHYRDPSPTLPELISETRKHAYVW